MPPNRACRFCVSRKSSPSLISVRARTGNGMRRPRGFLTAIRHDLCRSLRKSTAWSSSCRSTRRQMTGVYYNTAAVIDADGSVPRQIPQDPYSAGGSRLLREVFFQARRPSGYPVFDTAYVKLGVYICYDRHFPEGWRALALNGAEYIREPVRHRRRPEQVPVGAGATGVGRCQRRLHRCDQPYRQGRAVGIDDEYG